MSVDEDVNKELENAGKEFSGLKVLIVDDEAVVRRVLPRVLKAQMNRTGYEIVTFPNGLEALDYLEQEGGVAVLISDYRMPIMLGPELLMKVSQAYPETTRVMMSGTDSEPANGLADYFFPKPFDNEMVKATVRVALEDYVGRKKGDGDESRADGDVLRSA